MYQSPFSKVRKTAKGLALKRWFKEKWETPKGEKDYSKGENIFRPTVKVSEKTAATYSELTKAELAAAQKEKNATGTVKSFKNKKTQNA